MRWPRRIFFGILAAILGIAAFGALVMVLWNAVMPEIFGLPVLGYWQALALLLLSHILLRGWGGPWRRGWRGHWRGWHQDPRWAALSPEEREKLRQKWEERCGPWGRWEGRSGAEEQKPARENPAEGASTQHV